MKTLNYIKFCPDHYMEIENYELAKADNFKGWVCHHRNGEYFPTEWLMKNNMYWNRKDPHEFKFLTKAEHIALHNSLRILSEGTKNRISLANKGRKLGAFTDEHKLKISLSEKGKHLSAETRMKISENHHHLRTRGSSGMHWYTDGEHNYFGFVCPNGYRQGRT